MLFEKGQGRLPILQIFENLNSKIKQEHKSALWKLYLTIYDDKAIDNCVFLQRKGQGKELLEILNKIKSEMFDTKSVANYRYKLQRYVTNGRFADS
jgi:hypothetical protein